MSWIFLWIYTYTSVLSTCKNSVIYLWLLSTRTCPSCCKYQLDPIYFDNKRNLQTDFWLSGVQNKTKALLLISSTLDFCLRSLKQQAVMWLYEVHQTFNNFTKYTQCLECEICYRVTLKATLCHIKKNTKCNEKMMSICRKRHHLPKGNWECIKCKIRGLTTSLWPFPWYR